MICLTWILIASVLIRISNTQLWISGNGDILETNETTSFTSSATTPRPTQPLSTAATPNLAVDDNSDPTKRTELWTNLGIAVAFSCSLTIMCLAYVKTQHGFVLESQCLNFRTLPRRQSSVRDDPSTVTRAWLDNEV